MTDAFAELFAPLRIKGLTLRNRVVAPPMLQVRPVLSPEGIAWHRRLAAGGAGLVIVEGTSVRRLATKATVDEMRPLARAIHDEGAAACIQLFAVFEEAANLHSDAVAPDAPTAEQMETLIDYFARSAVLCRDAGFDAVEPHGAHGFLLNQFLMPDRNHRTDQFGGSPANRARLAERIVQAIRAAAGEELVILYRHSPTGPCYSMEDSLAMARRLVAAGLDVLDVSPARERTVADLAGPFKAALGVPVIAVGGMEDPAAASEALRQGRCDLVAVGRQLIADAAWPDKVRTGHYDQVVRCLQCDQGCFGNIREGKPAACVQWKEGELTKFVR